MKLQLGIKSDPVEYRYSYAWLFRLMRRHALSHLQLGSFFELYSLPDDYFLELRAEAAEYGVVVSSLFTAHRELGGFFTGNPYLEAAARRNYERYIQVAALLGADYAGSNPGAIYRDAMSYKERGIEVYIAHMRELMVLAREAGLKGLTIEPMSCLAEPPTLPSEIEGMLTALNDHHQANRDSTVPVYLCGDISHGYADADCSVVHGNTELFKAGIPWMCEYHIKNTDAVFSSTFGFGPEERSRGIVDIGELKELILANRDLWPVESPVGYLEINGPKTGRDYSDHLLKEQLDASLEHISASFRAAGAEKATSRQEAV